MPILYMNDKGELNVFMVARGNDVEEVIAKDIPEYADRCVMVDDSDMPEDQYYEAAWELAEGKVVVNMVKAVDIQKARLRQERQPMLEALDVAYMKALEAGDLKAQADIVAQKQALRDCTDSPLLTAARTPEELKAVSLAAILANQKAE